MTSAPADLVRALARDVCARWGMPEAADLIGIDQDGQILRLAIPCAGEDDRRYGIAVDDGLATDLRDGGGRAMDLRTRISEMVRLQARSACREMDDASAPAGWTLAVPRLFRDMLGICGLAPAVLLGRMDEYSGWEPEETGTPGMEISAVSVRAGRMLGTIGLRDGTSRVSVLATDDEDGACTVVIHDLLLPGTAALGMEGWPLDAVVAHPGIVPGGGHVVRHVAQREAYGRHDLHLVLEPDHVWAGEPPDDADVSWRRIREGRRLRLA